MEFEIGPFHFTSDFDSGNLAKVETISKESSKSRQTAKSFGEATSACPEPDFGFKIWTQPDCAGTPYENLNRSWFHFGIQCKTPSCKVQFVLQNLNKHTRLFSHGMAPVYRVDPGSPSYERIPLHPSYWLEEGQFYMSFIHILPEDVNTVTYFAFTYPFTYEQLQTDLEMLDSKFASDCKPDNDVPRNKIYYMRELVCHSLEGRRIDLLTVTSHHGILPQREPEFPGLFPCQEPRPHKFENKRVVFLSARVHPGETPSSFVMNGFLEFILREDDKRAAKLRKTFIIKVIPMLNPDGVVRGHYRTDTRGINLNRVYKDPIMELHPSIFAVKALVLYYHIACRIPERQPNPQCGSSNIYRFRKSFEMPRTSSKNMAESHECKGKNRSFTSLFESKFFNGKSSTKAAAWSESRHENMEQTTARRSLSARLHKSGADESIKGKASTTNHVSRRSSLNLMNKFVVNSKKASDATLKQQQQKPVSVSDDQKKTVVQRKDLLEVPTLREGPNPSSPLSTENFFTFSADWAMFVENVIQIRTELIETLRELRETIGASSSDTSGWSVTTKDSSNFSSLIPDVPDAVTRDVSQVTESSSGAERPCHTFSNATSDGHADVTNIQSPIAAPKLMQGRHLVVPQFVNLIPSECSGIAFYIDMHGHASKRGCFIYGNHFTDTREKVECMLFPKLLSINCGCFDFSACNFSHKNMYSTDKKDGTTKEGSGRVAIHNMTKIVRCYTLECNYNTGNWTHTVSKTSTPGTQSITLNHIYKPEVYEKVGRSVALTMLDMECIPNTGTKLATSEFKNIQCVREWLQQYTRCNELPIGLMNFPSSSTKNAKTNYPRNRLLAKARANVSPMTTAFAALEHNSVSLTPALYRAIIRRQQRLNHNSSYLHQHPLRWSPSKYGPCLIDTMNNEPKLKPHRPKTKTKRKKAETTSVVAGSSKNPIATNNMLPLFTLRKSAAKHYYTLWLLSKARVRKLSTGSASFTSHKKRTLPKRHVKKNVINSGN